MFRRFDVLYWCFNTKCDLGGTFSLGDCQQIFLLVLSTFDDFREDDNINNLLKFT